MLLATTRHWLTSPTGQVFFLLYHQSLKRLGFLFLYFTHFPSSFAQKRCFLYVQRHTVSKLWLLSLLASRVDRNYWDTFGHDVGSVPSLSVKGYWEVQCGGGMRLFVDVNDHFVNINPNIKQYKSNLSVAFANACITIIGLYRMSFICSNFKNFNNLMSFEIIRPCQIRFPPKIVVCFNLSRSCILWFNTNQLWSIISLPQLIHFDADFIFK